MVEYHRTNLDGEKSQINFLQPLCYCVNGLYTINLHN